MKRRNSAEEMFKDVIYTIKEKQNDLGRTLNEYTSNSPLKPNMDIVEDEEQLTVMTDLPGFKRQDITIDITEDTIEITAQFDEDTEAEGKNFLKKERNHVKVNRIINLPLKVRSTESSAKLENGVLTVILPKLEKKETFEVKVD
ncbi:Hsp20/alpha crystallin family protein [Methanobacterium sp. SMA-27]|jgi:HSP20 family protein|uniref:Hsp20/alpha crystallin family protein n=1 Tax=Methanobacterium sp. SMA-27 TaxID=1495336 RepID=UPI00064FFCAF|nr:Hsp20/alpha crystallin family protein [Methanobacterium sp. SMA-27]